MLALAGVVTMRKINKIIIHCAATTPEMDVGVKEIRQWHLARGFNDIGYHFVIRRNGEVEIGRKLEVVGAHAQGHNATSIGISLVGGCRRENGKLYTEDNFTPAQKATLESLVKKLQAQFPAVTICGHRDLDKGKDCPSFSVKDFFLSRGFAREWV